MKDRFKKIDKNLIRAMMMSSFLVIIGLIMHIVQPTYDGPIIFIVDGIVFIICLPLCWNGKDEVKEDWLGEERKMDSEVAFLNAVED